jgi:hypothetical protein
LQLLKIVLFFILVCCMKFFFLKKYGDCILIPLVIDLVVCLSLQTSFVLLGFFLFGFVLSFCKMYSLFCFG